MKNLIRVLSLVLCLSLVLFVACNPLRVSAVTDTVYIGTSLGEVAAVAPELLPICLLLVACGWWNSTKTCKQLIAKAEEVGTLGNLIRSWSADIAPQIIDGTSAFKIPTAVQQEFDNQIKKDGSSNELPPALPYLLVPDSLLELDNLSQNQLLSQDISGVIEEGNALTAKTNTILTQIRTFLHNFLTEYKELSSALNKNITSKLTTINSNITSRLLGIKGQLADLDRLLDARFVDINAYLANIHRLVEGKLVDVNAYLVAIKNNILTSASSLRTTISDSFEMLGIKIDNAVTTITQALSGGAGNGGGDDGDKIVDGTVSNGLNKGKLWFGNSSGFLSEYSNAFLVAGLIFNLFADIPIINKLIIVSASIGLVGVFLGIALNVSTKERYNEQKIKNNSNVKAGSN